MNTFASKAIALTVLAIDQAHAAQTCNALALGGGGSRGAYQAGAIHALMREGNPADYAWDVVTGISVGSVNATGLGMFAPEDGLTMSDFVKTTWDNLQSCNVYECCAFRRGAFLSIDPLTEFMEDTISNNLDGQFKRKTTIGLTRDID